MSTATLDLGDPTATERFFAGLPAPVDHVLVTGGGPPYVPIADLDFDEALRVLDEHLLGSLRVARACAAARPARRFADLDHRYARAAARRRLEHRRHPAAAMPAIAANIAVELAPMRANVIAAGFVDTPLSARILGDELDTSSSRAPRDPADRTGGRAGRCRRARRSSDDEHGRDRSNVRRRRGPAAHPVDTRKVIPALPPDPGRAAHHATACVS